MNYLVHFIQSVKELFVIKYYPKQVFMPILISFKAPSLTELIIFSEKSYGNTYGNPDLKPEESISL